jgi:flagellar protein FlgJ
VSVNRAAVSPTAAGEATGESALSLEMTGRVSSAYGWRSDPFRGQAKFHGGIDLAAKYGTEVPAAAAGTVVSAGDQGGYGLTVVVRHPNGFESRYAHLSSLAVREGDTVGQGQQVGRVGSTGRSTGPHLHFEVTQAGRRVDPERFVRNLTSDIKGQ